MRPFPDALGSDNSSFQCSNKSLQNADCLLKTAVARGACPRLPCARRQTRDAGGIASDMRQATRLDNAHNRRKRPPTMPELRKHRSIRSSALKSIDPLSAGEIRTIGWFRRRKSIRHGSFRRGSFSECSCRMQEWKRQGVCQTRLPSLEICPQETSRACSVCP